MPIAGGLLIIRRGRYSSLCSRASQRSRTWPGIHYNPHRESDEGTDAVSEERAGRSWVGMGEQALEGVGYIVHAWESLHEATLLTRACGPSRKIICYCICRVLFP